MQSPPVVNTRLRSHPTISTSYVRRAPPCPTPVHSRCKHRRARAEIEFHLPAFDRLLVEHHLSHFAPHSSSGNHALNYSFYSFCRLGQFHLDARHYHASAIHFDLRPHAIVRGIRLHLPVRRCCTSESFNPLILYHPTYSQTSRTMSSDEQIRAACGESLPLPSSILLTHADHQLQTEHE